MTLFYTLRVKSCAFSSSPRHVVSRGPVAFTSTPLGPGYPRSPFRGGSKGHRQNDRHSADRADGQSAGMTAWELSSEARGPIGRQHMLHLGEPLKIFLLEELPRFAFLALRQGGHAGRPAIDHPVG